MNDYGDGINELIEALEADERFSEDSLKIVKLLVESAFTKGRIYEMEKELKSG